MLRLGRNNNLCFCADMALGDYTSLCAIGTYVIMCYDYYVLRC